MWYCILTIYLPVFILIFLCDEKYNPIKKPGSAMPKKQHKSARSGNHDGDRNGRRDALNQTAAYRHERSFYTFPSKLSKSAIPSFGQWISGFFPA